MSIQILGADEVGDEAQGGWGGIVGPILQAAGGIAQGSIAMHEKSEADKKSAAEEKAALDKMTQADAAVANTAATAKVMPTAINKAAAEAATKAQERAALKLSASAQEKRLEAAEKALETAVAQAQAFPRDKYKAALVESWTNVVSRIQGGGALVQSQSKNVPSSPEVPKSSESFLTRKVVGPVPVWGAVGAVGVVAVLADKLVFKRFLFKA